MLFAIRSNGARAIAVIALAMASAASAAAPTIGATSSRVAPDKVTVKWTDTSPIDVYVSDRPDATTRTARLVSRADADGQLDVADTKETRHYFLLRDPRSGAEQRTAERLIPLDRGSNFRDIGGYEAFGGKHIRWGLIYRSGATPVLTDDDIVRIKRLGLKDMVDLRSSEERVIAPTRLTGIRYTAIDYSMTSMMGARKSMVNGVDLYREFPSFFVPHLKIVFEDLIEERGPLLYHCSAGQDRTGFVTAMILSALGVPRDVITADYHLSTTYRQPQNELPVIDEAAARTNPVAAMFAAYQKSGSYSKAQPLQDANGKAFLDGAFDEIDARWGSVDAYLEKEVGVSRSDLALLRATYLE